MNLQEVITFGCVGKTEMMGATYDSIVWKHITEEEYNNLSSDEKLSYTLNETSYSGDSQKFTLKQLLHPDGTIEYQNLLSIEEYEKLDDELKVNYKIAHKMYSHVPIPLEEIEDAYSKYINETRPMIDLRKKRDTLLRETDKYAIIDWPHSTPAIKQAWMDYRQALRDIPSVTKDPMNVVWPNVPTL